jgi:hypothetical protein
VILQHITSVNERRLKHSLLSLLLPLASGTLKGSLGKSTGKLKENLKDRELKL